MLIYTLPIIAAFTGWLTNFIAIKMLFHPKEEVKVLFLRIQGIFPKRKAKLAEKLGKIVSDELFSIDDIKESLASDDTSGEVEAVLEERVDDFLENKLTENMPMLKMFLNAETKMQIKAVLMSEFSLLIPEIVNTYTQKIEESVDVEEIVYTKVVNFSSDKLEEILYSIMQKEFRFVELLGGVLGFIIGWIQIGILFLQNG